MNFGKLITPLIFAAACREYPHPVTRASVATLEQAGDEAAEACDELLTHDDCLGGSVDNENPKGPALHMPDAATKLTSLKSLAIGCRAKSSPKKCLASFFVHGERLSDLLVSDCKWEPKWISGSYDEESRGRFTEISGPTKLECRGGWFFVDVGRVTKQGNQAFVTAQFAAPEAEAPGGGIHYLIQREKVRTNDGDELCSQEAFDSCFSSSARPSNCGKLRLIGEGSRELIADLVKHEDAEERAQLADAYLVPIYRTNQCSLVWRVRHDPHRQWNELVKKANAKGPPRMFIGPSSVYIELTPAIQKGAQPAIPALTKCYDAARPRLGNGRVGEVHLEINFDKRGKPIDVIYEGRSNPKQDDALIQCIQEAFKLARFDPTKLTENTVGVIVTDMTLEGEAVFRGPRYKRAH